MMFFLFFIPEALIAIFGVSAILGYLFIGDAAENICRFCRDKAGAYRRIWRWLSGKRGMSLTILL